MTLSVDMMAPMLWGLDLGEPFFDGRQSVFNAVVTATLFYPLLVLILRIAGKRSMSKMNNFDWIVTVALGSLIASAVVFDSVTILDTGLAIIILLGLQRLLTLSMAKSASVKRIVVSSPTLLVHKGEMLEEAILRERLTHSEVHSAIRAAGLSDPADCYAVVMEANATLVVVPMSEYGKPCTSLSDLDAFQDVTRDS